MEAIYGSSDDILNDTDNPKTLHKNILKNINSNIITFEELLEICYEEEEPDFRDHEKFKCVPNYDGKITVLIYAIKNNKPDEKIGEIIKNAIKKDPNTKYLASIDNEKRTALMYACMNKKIKVIETLLLTGLCNPLKRDDIGNDALTYSIINCIHKTIKSLVIIEKYGYETYLLKNIRCERNMRPIDDALLMLTNNETHHIQ